MMTATASTMATKRTSCEAIALDRAVHRGGVGVTTVEKGDNDGMPGKIRTSFDLKNERADDGAKGPGVVITEGPKVPVQDHCVLLYQDCDILFRTMH